MRASWRPSPLAASASSAPSPPPCQNARVATTRNFSSKALPARASTISSTRGFPPSNNYKALAASAGRWTSTRSSCFDYSQYRRQCRLVSDCCFPHELADGGEDGSDRVLAIEHGGEHRYALLGERIRQVAPATAAGL